MTNFDRVCDNYFDVKIGTIQLNLIKISAKTRAKKSERVLYIIALERAAHHQMSFYVVIIMIFLKVVFLHLFWPHQL